MGGAGFAIANILLARDLSTTEYGQFALVIAVLNLGVAVGPLGIDSAIVRHHPGVRTSLLRTSLASGATTGLLLAVSVWLIYEMAIPLALLVGIAIMAGAVTRAGAAIYQSEENYGRSLLLIQSQNMTLILAALVAGMFAGFSSLIVFSILAFHWVMAAGIGWTMLLTRPKQKLLDNWKMPWREIPPLFGYIVTIQVVTQLDRLLLPKIMDIENLATFGVLAAMVISPYKMFELGVAYTLIPSLRSATSHAKRIASLRHEAMTTLLVIALGAISGFLLFPWASTMFLGDKYTFSNSLIGAAVFAGSVRVFVSFISSIVTALGDASQLTNLHRSSWFSMIVSIVGCWWGSRWGLPGFIYGFAMGSIARLVLASAIAIKAWHAPMLSKPQAAIAN